MTQQWTARFSVTVSRCHGPSLAAGGHRQTASGRPHAESPTRDGAGRRNGRPAQIESRGTVPRALIPAAGSNEPRTRPHEQIAGRAEAPPLARAARAAGVTAAACDGDLSGARRSGSALALLPSRPSLVPKSTTLFSSAPQRYAAAEAEARQSKFEKS